MIGVIDYGASNLRSVANALRFLDVPMTIITRPEDAVGLDRLVLPGVGAFAPGMEQLRQRGFVDFLRLSVAEGVPLLGICLGMQFLLDESEEDGLHAGLGLIQGRCVRFKTSLKVPHMGWNQLHHPETHLFMGGVPSESSYAYFVHSYHAVDVPPECVIATTDYDYAYPAIIGQGGVVGVQFHPEKSQQVGLRLLQNFCEGRV
jgi:imidazole glycerol-phosphate synthase subunit HisH